VEQNAVALAGKLSQEVLAKHAAEVDRDKKFPTEAVQAIQKAGLSGLLVPAKDGGLGADAPTCVKVWELLAQGCASTALSFVAHCAASAALASGARGLVRQEELAELVKGSHLCALALAEPASGSRPVSPEVAFTRGDQGYTLNGMKAFVTSALHADSFLVSASEKGTEKVSLFLLPAWVEGIQLYGEWHSLGMRGSMSINLRLQNAALEEKYRLGEEGQGAELLDALVNPYFALGMAAVDVGIAQAALDATVKHVKTRRYSRQGGALSDAPVIRDQLGRMCAGVETARSVTHRAAWALAKDGPVASRRLISIAKLTASRHAAEVTEMALQVCGGRGYTQTLAVERHFRDARAGAVIGPTSGWLAKWLGQEMVK
jgi:alkylation response protein AidB-like acyl-CoA dehydrogenase